MSLRGLMVGTVVLLGCQLNAEAAVGEPIAPKAALQDAGLTEYWGVELPYRRGDAPNGIWLREGTLYISTRQGDLHAVDPQVGLLRWTHPVGEGSHKLFEPQHLTAPDGKPAVAVTHQNGVMVYERYSGAQLADVPNLWTAGSAAVGDTKSLYVGSTDGFLYAILWNDPIHHYPRRTWKVRGEGPITSNPLLMNGILYFASQNGSVYACTADWNKDLKWQHRTEAALVADLYGDESGVYIAGLDRSLYRVEAESGTLLWRYRFPQPLRESPVVAQRTAYQPCRGVGLYAIDVDTNELLWKNPEAEAFISRRADRTCVRTTGDRIAVLDSTSGETRATVPVPADSLIASNPNALTFYLATPDGRLACYTSSDVKHLLADDITRGLRPPAGGDQPADPDAEPVQDVESTADVDRDDPLRSGADRR